MFICQLPSWAIGIRVKHPNRIAHRLRGLGKHTTELTTAEYAEEDAEFLKSISTSEHITSQYPPVFISGGNKDFLTKSQSLPFVEVLKQHQVAVTEAFYPDSNEFLVHEYQFMMSKQASQITFDRTIDFIKQTSNLTEKK